MSNEHLDAIREAMAAAALAVDSSDDDFNDHLNRIEHHAEALAAELEKSEAKQKAIIDLRQELEAERARVKRYLNLYLATAYQAYDEDDVAWYAAKPEIDRLLHYADTGDFGDIEGGIADRLAAARMEHSGDMNDSHIDPAGEYRGNGNTQRAGDVTAPTPDHRAVIFAEGVHDALAIMREKLLDPDLAHTIAGEMFLHGYEGDLAEATTVPPIAIGAVIGHLFGECHVCAEHEVRRALANAEQPDEPAE